MSMMAWSLGALRRSCRRPTLRRAHARRHAPPPRAKTKIWEWGYRCRTIFRTRCAEAPNPVNPRFCPSRRPASRRDRYPIAREQRGGFGISEGIGNAMSKSLGHGHQLGIAAVDIATRGTKLFAQVLFASATETASSASGEDPGNADPITGSEPLVPSPESATRPTT